MVQRYKIYKPTEKGMETFTVTLTKLTDKGMKESVVKYTKSGNYYKGKIIKGSKVRVPQLSSRKNINGRLLFNLKSNKNSTMLVGKFRAIIIIPTEGFFIRLLKTSKNSSEFLRIVPSIPKRPNKYIIS